MFQGDKATKNAAISPVFLDLKSSKHKKYTKSTLIAPNKAAGSLTDSASRPRKATKGIVV